MKPYCLWRNNKQNRNGVSQNPEVAFASPVERAVGPLSSAQLSNTREGGVPTCASTKLAIEAEAFARGWVERARLTFCHQRASVGFRILIPGIQPLPKFFAAQAPS